jgi:hypothetical protein
VLVADARADAPGFELYYLLDRASLHIAGNR